VEGLAELALYALAWLSFAAGHSWLAGETGQRVLKRRFGVGARLAYNAIALVHVALVVALGRALLPAAPLFEPPPWLARALVAVHVAAWVALAGALAGYDLGRFSGLAQLRAGAEPVPEPLRARGLNAYVRHPLYSAAMVALWTVARSPFAIATALFASAYLVIGSRLEERRLGNLYGAPYFEYVRSVPAFVPWKGRAWSVRRGGDGPGRGSP
jgi:protein-S-isoprenylcysteine O-methyltransferase Ste14